MAHAVAQRQLVAIPGHRLHRAVIQREKAAYRVEYPTYKVQMNDAETKVTGFRGLDDGMGINISFIQPDHSEYFLSERGEDQQRGLRTVKFAITDDLWNAIDFKATGKTKSKDVKPVWRERVEKLKDPSWSDGKNLPKGIKQTALGFKDPWLDVLIKGVTGVASVVYVADDEGLWTDATLVWAYTEGDDPKTGGDVYDYNAAKEAGFEHVMSLERAERLGYKDED